jgi:hypothetical protein
MPSFIQRLEKHGFLRGYYNQLQHEEEMNSALKKKKTKKKTPIVDKDGLTLVVKKSKR